MSLINHEFIRRQIVSDERFAGSHGGSGDGFLGLGALYYALAYAYRAQRCVCLGSGSGFVPRLMRQAQRDLELPNSETVLVDADLPELGYGKTDYFGPNPSAFRTLYPEVVVLKMRSDDYLKIEGDDSIDYLHIDADHSYEGATADFLGYSRKMRKVSVITLHDTINRAPNLGVWKLIREIRAMSNAWDVIEVPLGMGTAILTRKMSHE